MNRLPLLNYPRNSKEILVKYIVDVWVLCTDVFLETVCCKAIFCNGVALKGAGKQQGVSKKSLRCKLKELDNLQKEILINKN